MIYWVSALFFFMAGLYPRYGYKILFPLVAALPISNAFSEHFYKFGLNSYDYFFLGSIVYLVIKSIQTGLIRRSGLEIYILLTGILIIISLYFHDISKYIIRDLRLILVLIFGHVTYIIFSSRRIISSTYSLYIFLAASLSCIFWGSLIKYGYLQFSDQFYTDNAYRFFSASTYISATFLIFSSKFILQNQNERILFLIAVLLSAIAVLMSGLRLLTIIVMAIFIISRVKKLSTNTIIFSILSLISILFINQFNNELFSRLFSLDINTISSNTLIRFSPFFQTISEFTDLNYLFGAGFGTTFEIPWFEWRNKLEQNNFIDSTYLTLYAKLGLISFIYIAGFIKSFTINLPAYSSVQIILLAFILLLMTFYAVPYQTAYIGILLTLPLLRPLITNSNEKNN